MNRTRQRKKTAASRAAADAGLADELRAEVKRAIVATTPSSYPAVRARLTDVAGYQQVEDAVIHLVLHNLITPSAALALLESEWGGLAG